MVEFGYHGQWYTFLIIDIIDWNDLEKLVNSSDGKNRYKNVSIQIDIFRKDIDNIDIYQ